MAISSGVSTPSVSGGMWYALFSLDAGVHDYEDYLKIARFSEILSNEDE